MKTSAKPAFAQRRRRLRILWALCVLVGLSVASLVCGYLWLTSELPSVDDIRTVTLEEPMQIYTSDHKLLGEFGEFRRYPITLDQVPASVRHAFLAAEDGDFYQHPGVDWRGTVRAAWILLRHSGEVTQGGSTITQQVVRNMYLSSERTFRRKMLEMVLALRIEKHLTKDEILALYLNKIYLGHRSYGVVAAAQFYYGKPLTALSVPEAATLASLPKFPSTGNPIDNPLRARERRDYVLARMRDLGWLDDTAFNAALATPETARPHQTAPEVAAPYVADMVRQEALKRWGNEAMTRGLRIDTTIDSRLQVAAQDAVWAQLVVYEERQRYRGPEVSRIASAQDRHSDAVTSNSPVNAYGPWQPAWVVAPPTARALRANRLTEDGRTEAVDVAIPPGWSGSAGLRRVSVGDLVRVVAQEDHQWRLSQLPQAQAAFVAIRPEDGAIVALVGGSDFDQSQFNRVTQSARSMGSAFKPFLYSAALDDKFTPASMVEDAPIKLPDTGQAGRYWEPHNYNYQYAGPMRLREALAQSKNVVAVRLLMSMGITSVDRYLAHFGFDASAIPTNASLALGTLAASPLQVARGYAVWANGGFLISPYVLAQVRDRQDHIIEKVAPARACAACEDRLLLPEGQALPQDFAPRVLDERTAFLMTSLLQSVVDHGVASGARILGRRDLAGKTGSTNDYRDGWFAGYGPGLVATVWFGRDDFRSLGPNEYGARTALPIWIQFMKAALPLLPPEEPPVAPPGVVNIWINKDTGVATEATDPQAMREWQKVESLTKPAENTPASSSSAAADSDVFNTIF